ncbi:MAG: SpoIIE family protein phosphatase [Planctomycetota bacterium]
MSASSSAHNLKCNEIWGGIQAAESSASVPGIDAWVICKPHMGAVGGGDIYYVGLCGRGMKSRFVVADVSGHGEVVASYATKLHDMMEEQMDTVDQSQLVKALNEGFPSLVSSEHFATAVIMSYTPMAKHMVVVNAGHPRPLWYSRRKNRWQILSHDVSEGADKLLELPSDVAARSAIDVHWSSANWLSASVIPT